MNKIVSSLILASAAISTGAPTQIDRASDSLFKALELERHHPGIAHSIVNDLSNKNLLKDVINKKNQNGITPLMSSIPNNDVAKLLLMYGADPNRTSSHPLKHPILFATVLGDKDLVDTLLYYGAKPNVIHEITGQTPLMYAIKNNQNDITKTLLEHSANPYIPDQKGNTALDLAKDNFQMFFLLNRKLIGDLEQLKKDAPKAASYFYRGLNVLIDHLEQ